MYSTALYINYYCTPHTLHRRPFGRRMVSHTSEPRVSRSARPNCATPTTLQHHLGRARCRPAFLAQCA